MRPLDKIHFCMKLTKNKNGGPPQRGETYVAADRNGKVLFFNDHQILRNKDGNMGCTIFCITS